MTEVMPRPAPGETNSGRSQSKNQLLLCAIICGPSWEAGVRHAPVVRRRADAVTGSRMAEPNRSRAGILTSLERR